MNRWAIAFVAAFTPLIIAQKPVDKLDDDLAKLHGTWKLIYSENNGKGIKPTNDVRNIYEKNIVIEQAAGELVTKLELKIDVSKKPRTMELTILENRLIPESRGTKLCTIYELDGDRLKICFPSDLTPTKFPTDFSSKGTNQRVDIYERVKR